MDRYPRIFSESRDYFGDQKDLKILSFGCSTGEEVITLRRYFPNAVIVGAEINRRALAKCRELPIDEKISFIYSANRTIRRLGPFDAIFCMAVLQRDPHRIIEENITDLTEIYPFSKFEQQVAELDRYLRKDGLFIIHFTPYLFDDTAAAVIYEALEMKREEADLVPKFDKNNIRIKIAAPSNSIFIKKRFSRD